MATLVGDAWRRATALARIDKVTGNRTVTTWHIELLADYLEQPDTSLRSLQLLIGDDLNGDLTRLLEDNPRCEPPPED